VQYDLAGTRHTSVWGACVNSDHSNPTTAVATSRGIRCIYPNLSSTHPNWAVHEDDDHSDVLAVRWLSPFLLVGGCRSGLVDLHDQRVPKKVDLLKHSSAVTSLRSIDEHRVLVAGMNNQVISAINILSSVKLQTKHLPSCMHTTSASALRRLRRTAVQKSTPVLTSITKLQRHPISHTQLTVTQPTGTSGSKSRVHSDW